MIPAGELNVMWRETHMMWMNLWIKFRVDLVGSDLGDMEWRHAPGADRIDHRIGNSG